MSFRPVRLLVVVAAVTLLSGCVEELQHDLSEQDANDIMALLLDNSIAAKKAKLGEEGYTVSVPKGDYATSVRLLREYSLPRPMSEGFGGIRKGGGMIPTQTEEKAKWHEAVAGEISNSLNKVEGVLEARVIVALPEATDLTQPEQKPKASASVFLKVKQLEDGSLPVNEDKVRQFVVTGTTTEIDPKNVTVIISKPSAEASKANTVRMQEVLGLTMTASSATTFKMMMGIVSLIIVALAGGLTMQFLRGGGNNAQRGRVRPKTEA